MILDEEFYSGPIEAGIGDKTASVKVNWTAQTIE